MAYAGVRSLLAPPNVRSLRETPSDTGHHINEPLGLPLKFPAVLSQELAWVGPQFEDETHYIYPLLVTEIAEVDAALARFKTLGLDGDQINIDNFPLPTLGTKLVDLSAVLYNGRGFFVLRGIQPRDYSVEDLTMIWLGIQAYIADQLHIVADNTSDEKIGHHRHSTSAITFHTEEAGDITTWLTRSTAASGGQCIIASAYNVYNILATHRPDIIRTLAKADWAFVIPRFHCRPIIFYEDGKLIMNFTRTPLLGNTTHPRPEHLPKTSEKQRETLDIVEAIAQATQLEIRTQPGDMHFINNLAILHRREGFVDGQSKQGMRHLVRMRLRSSKLGWNIPPELQKEWEDTFEEDLVKIWHLEPTPGDAFPLRKYTN
ncbi:hypothetical protein JX265_013666 [Neoarthrinium moseri]|uniref:TauD/TfdA-like domain-containing protein n=1 Tax=Neoarthrinium moseri TaxID=1658444 RepID=A0A9P9W836_9PEZI|nr:hypothetical protein JX265_013666 [Neoarthrinium moseri]